MACLNFVNNDANKQFIRHNEKYEKFIDEDPSGLINQLLIDDDGSNKYLSEFLFFICGSEDDPKLNEIFLNSNGLLK